MDVQWSLFLSKSQTFGLGQTIWADKFWGILGIFGQFISIDFGTIAQSICTQYSSLSGQPDIFLGLEQEKNQVQKKAGCKKNGSLLLKKKRGQIASSLFE